MTKYDVILLAFVGAIMAQTGCSRQVAVERVATLCAMTEERMGIKVELTNA